MKTTYEECTYFELLRKADGERDTYSGECRLHPPLRQAQLTARAAYLPLGGWPPRTRLELPRFRGRYGAWVSSSLLIIIFIV